MVCNPFCCTSIRKGAKRIAVIDIVLFFATLAVSVGLEWSVFNSVPMRLVLFNGTSGENGDDVAMRTTMMEPEDNKPMIGKAVWVHITLAIKHATGISTTLGYLMYMGLLLAMMGYMILEIWLCCVLIRAATEKRPEFCNKWLLWKSVLLFLCIAMTGINLVQMQYTVTDIVLQPLNVLRLYSLLVGWQLKKKLYKMDPKLVY